MSSPPSVLDLFLQNSDEKTDVDQALRTAMAREANGRPSSTPCSRNTRWPMVEFINLINDISTAVRLGWVGVLMWGIVQFMRYQRGRALPENMDVDVP